MKPEEIKLIIWDLDDTFWKGTFSEGEVVIPEEHRKFLLDTTDMGIIHSICSKNDFSKIEEKLKSEKLWEYFVFPSIDWTAKGIRVKSIIQTMKLRAQNVIFIDDNVQNLEEVRHFCPGIAVLSEKEIPDLIEQVKGLEKKDPTHKRLQQYHLLEQKETARAAFESNEDFLKSCNIRVQMENNAIDQIDRVHELVMRSNQLNYTKIRPTKEELLTFLKKEGVESGTVSVSDQFGSYGLVGFYAVENEKAVHYVFSCRTLGMKVEQYVYAEIGFPEIEISGEVVSELNRTERPAWINQEAKGIAQSAKASLSKTLCLKGPCDLSQMHAFFNYDKEDSVVTEFTYINDAGVSVEGQNHTAQIATALLSEKETKQKIVREINFFDEKMLDTALLEKEIDAVVLSMLTDGNLGVYRRKEGGQFIAFGEKAYPLDDPANREKYLKGEIFTSRVNFTEEMIDRFSEKYEFCDNSDFSITMQSLEGIRSHLPQKTLLILLLGSEREFSKPSKPSFENRHLEHRKMNALIREWAKEKENVLLLSYDDCMASDSDFLDTINHFTKRVYYAIAKEIIAVLNGSEKGEFAVKGKFNLFLSSAKQRLREIKKAILSKK